MAKYLVRSTFYRLEAEMVDVEIEADSEEEALAIVGDEEFDHFAPEANVANSSYAYINHNVPTHPNEHRIISKGTI